MHEFLFIWAWFSECIFLCVYNAGLGFPSPIGIQECVQLHTLNYFGFICNSTVGLTVRNTYQCYLPICMSNCERTWERGFIKQWDLALVTSIPMRCVWFTICVIILHDPVRALFHAFLTWLISLWRRGIMCTHS